MAVRRILPGTKNEALSDWGDGPDDEPPDFSTPLAVQQFLQAEIRRCPSNFEKLLTAPPGLETRWQYEHMRCGWSVWKVGSLW